MQKISTGKFHLNLPLPSHHSITSSARVRKDSGIVNPSALAVVRLMTRSNFVGCWIGKSPGFAPRRTLSTYSAARRFRSGKLGRDVLNAPDGQWDDLEAERASCGVNLFPLRQPAGIVSIGHDGQPTQIWENLAHEFEAFGSETS